MKKLILLFIGFLAFVQLQAQNGVAISTSSSATPHASAILDVQSTSQGVLIPRVDITDLATPAPMSAVVTSLLVYNTNTTTGPGFFFWDGKWHSLASSKNPNTVSIDSLADARAFSTSVFIGATSGNSATGTKNTGLGDASFHSLTTGYENVAIGYLAGKTITTGSLNIMIGAGVNGINPSSATASHELNIGNAIYAKHLYSTTGTISVGINNQNPDASSILDLTSTSKGLLIPRLDIDDLSTAAPVTSPTTSLMAYNTNATTGLGFYYWDGSAWTAIGGNPSVSKIDDLTDAISSNNNVILGDNAGTAITGSQNVGIGVNALNAATSVSQSVAVGYNALMNCSADQNTAIGQLALMANTSGAGNTALGYEAGSNITTGSNNIIIGRSVETSSPSAHNEVNIGNVIYATNLYGTDAKVGIGFQHNDPKSTLDVKGSVSKPIVIQTGDYTATAYDYTIIFNQTYTVNLYLPDATAAPGRIYVVRTTNITSGEHVIIRANGNDVIYRHSNTGYATMELGYVNATMKYYSETLQSDGAGGWWIIDAWEEH